MEPNLTSSITMHPHVFRVDSSPPSRPASHGSSLGPAAATTPDSSSRATGTGGNKPKKNNGSSTSVEVKAKKQDATVERHPVGHPGSPGSPGGPSGVTDVESQTAAGAGGATRLPHQSAESDPYGLSSAFKTDRDLEQIRPSGTYKRTTGTSCGGAQDSVVAGGSGPVAANSTIPANPANTTSGEDNSQTNGLSCFPLSLPRLFSLSGAGQSSKVRKLQGFYKSQNATIERMLKTVEEHQAEAHQEQGEDQLKFRIAVYGSFLANCILAAVQIYGAASSDSLSLYTTMADAVFDPLSNITLILTSRAVKRVNPARFPSGKARLETIGNIVFCFLMTAVSLILIAFSAKDLTEGRAAGETVNKFHLPSVVAVVVAFSTKFALFLYTWLLKDKYSQVRILWQDHGNDLLINGFGILTSVGGSKLVWWVDPMGAIIISIAVSSNWLRTAFTEFLLLVGVVASVETQQLITYVCMTHSPAVQQIDTVRVYHSGPRLIAEVDIVMEPQATLMETHDVAEALQSKLECLPDIERAYVHVDYETTHKPEHAYKKDM